ncbi:endonuclease/exonuclease/phosphatase family protein [Photobacterium lipolyticum]|uniref:Metal-dependent hydrolase n=1 Tax=Photobacterium lipolyticum TaxID=266810 RepID=A0A2T3MYX9_9GAMM|nr:endonuclease/exonuclease/phosphatase family protein [Photobacterium lipolyticum]PSW05175.1 metal-dependent hydrolase [Photobacterium lipolyticum]
MAYSVRTHFISLLLTLSIAPALAADIASASVSLVSWNMQWLSLSEQFPESRRSDLDYQKMRSIFTTLSPDIFAFQEVDSLAVLKKIVPESEYHFYFSDRSNKASESYLTANQYTGFAVRSHLDVSDPSDLHQLNRIANNQTGKLRYGSYLIVQLDNETQLHLLSVHLKSGCFSKKQQNLNKQCKQLKRQTNVLADWINQRQEKQQSYMILGDFNHRLNDPNEWLLTYLNSRLKHPLVHLTAKTKANCWARVSNTSGQVQLRLYRSLIDHILVSQDIAGKINDQENVYQLSFEQEDVKQYQLSDHCPIVAHIPLFKH